MQYIASVDGSVFENTPYLKYYRDPDGIFYVGNILLYGSDNDFLKTFTVKEGTTRIEEFAFAYDCRYLTSIILPNTLRSIGECAFSGCENLSTITLPNSITEIEPDVFEECTGLTSVTCYAPNPPSVVFPKRETCWGIPEYVLEEDYDDEIKNPFDGIDVSKIPLYVPAQSIPKYRAAKYWQDFIILPAAEDALQNVSAKQNSSKIIRDGQVLIQHNGKAYTISGNEVK